MDSILSEHVMSLHSRRNANPCVTVHVCLSLSSPHHCSGLLKWLLQEGLHWYDHTLLSSMTEVSSCSLQGQCSSSNSSMLILDDSDLTTSLADRLKTPQVNFDPVPSQLLRKYIEYARKYVHPRLSPGAAEVLQEFYLDLRKKRQAHDTTPITTRQLESLIRLTEVCRNSSAVII